MHENEYASTDASYVTLGDYNSAISSRDSQICDLQNHIEKLTEVNKILNKLNKDNQRDSDGHEKYMDESIAISGKTPIWVAQMLINHQTHFEKNLIFPARDNNTFSIGELEEIADYLSRILEGKAFDKKGLIYGMGHAVYSLSDPRERIFKGYVEQLAKEKHMEKELLLYNTIEETAPVLIACKRNIQKGVSPNVDFYSGFVYEMLGIPVEMYTAIFAIARIVGWSAHRIEEMITADRIIRPAYMSVMSEKHCE